MEKILVHIQYVDGFGETVNWDEVRLIDGNASRVSDMIDVPGLCTDKRLININNVISIKRVKK